MQTGSDVRGRGIPRWRFALVASSLVSATLSMAVLETATAPAAFGAPKRVGTNSAGSAIERSLEDAPDAPDMIAPAAKTAAAAPFHPAMLAAEYAAAKAAAAGAVSRPKPGSTSTSAAPAVLRRGATFSGTDEATGC